MTHESSDSALLLKAQDQLTEVRVLIKKVSTFAVTFESAQRRELKFLISSTIIKKCPRIFGSLLPHHVHYYVVLP